jgi:hypothetical protein
MLRSGIPACSLQDCSTLVSKRPFSPLQLVAGWSRFGSLAVSSPYHKSEKVKK